MDSEPLAVIKIGGTDGVIIPLHIFRDDDPAVLAKKFVVENGLPNEIILKLSAQIQSHISQALMSCNEMLKDKQLSGSDSDDDSVESVTNQFSMLLNRGSQYRHFDGNSNLTPSTSTHLDRDENIISQTPSHSHHFEESFNKAKETWSSTANRSLMDIRRPESMLSNMKKSRSDSNLNVSLSGSVNGDARSVSRPRSPSALSIQTTPNRPVYDRLYQEAGHSQQRLNHLRERVEEEREEAVRSSSFIETSGLRSPSVTGRTPRGRTESPAPFSGGKRRALSGGHSSSASLAKTPDGSEIPANEYLYYCQQQWMKDKDAATAKLARSLAADREQALQKELTLQPEISTSRAMQMRRSGDQSSNDVFHALHDASRYYADRRRQLKQQSEQQFSDQYSFVPQITPNSKRIVRRRQLERSGVKSGDEQSNSLSTSPVRADGDLHQMFANEADATGLNNQNLSSFIADSTNVDQDTAMKVEFPHPTPVPLVLGDLDVSSAGREWNPFDERSKHYSTFSPPTLVAGTNQFVASPQYVSALPCAFSQPAHSPIVSHETATRVPSKSSGSSNSPLREMDRLRVSTTLSSTQVPRVVDGPHPYRGPAVYNKPNMMGMVRQSNAYKGQVPTRQERMSVEQLQTSRVTSGLSGNSNASQTNKNLFDRLYEARNDSALEQNRAKNIHTPRFSHSPYIGSSSARPIERKKDAFFERLYEQSGERMGRSIVKQEAEERRRQAVIASSSFVAHRAGRIGASTRLTTDQTASHVSRLLESKQRSAIKVESAKNQIDSQIDQQQHSRFIRGKSDAIASKAHAEALSEIFSVLLVTVLLNSSSRPSSETKAGSTDDSESTSSGTQSVDDTQTLNVSLAQPGMLQPKLLADCITSVLVGHQEPLMTREQFVSTALRRMGDGSLPPMGYLLSQPGRASKPVSRQRSAMLRSSEQLQLQECRQKPSLVARKTTDLMVKARYEQRRLGTQSVEDSLLSYRAFQETNRNERLVEREKDAKRECPFIPNTQSPYMAVFQRTSADSRSVSSQSSWGRSKRSSSAPPRNTNRSQQHADSSLFLKMRSDLYM